MIDIATFYQVRSEFGHFASWAVWADQGMNPKDGIADLDPLDPNKNPELLRTIHADAILVGLNISRRIDRPFGNFHDPRPMATDFKIRHALKDSILWGAYMTDIIKNFEQKASGKMMTYLRRNKDFEKDNIAQFIEEISSLGVSDPLLVAFGKDAEAVLRRNLKNEFRIFGVPHYANYSSKENYRDQVLQNL
ncbi:MAG TPA: hypothetical protein EYQ50_09115 [Verrucomicrobiales bacterium]|nr:hypothetical protein [Verrucomicrobiales bacterium]